LTLTDSFEDWTPITIHLNGEISARDRTDPYKGFNFAAYPGDIVFSKIDARSGAIGVLPPEIAKAVVTTEFPVFVPDPARLDGEFVKLVLRTGGFIEALRRKASGTSGRKRITPEAFQNLRIPLPPLDEQQVIVAAWRNALDLAAALKLKADQAETKAAEAFETALGFAPPTPLPDRPIFVASFRNLDRWSHEGILRRIIDGATNHTLPWPTVQLGEVIADLENGWSPKCHNRTATNSEWGVLKLGAVSFGRFDEAENKVLPNFLKPRAHLEVRAGEVLISRANITRLVGATAMIQKTRQKLMLCDKIFRVVPLHNSPADLSFLTEVLRIPSVRRQIEANVTGTSPTMKNISKPALLGLTFPLPPISEQQKMVQNLSDARTEAASLRADAANVRLRAWTAFEAAVYGAKDAAQSGEDDFADHSPRVVTMHQRQRDDGVVLPAVMAVPSPADALRFPANRWRPKR
jgi:type I restriction enzyme S subunit